MPSGGARVRSGPPPDPNALRRDRRSDGEWTLLPAEGRKGKPPEWPLTSPTPRELDLWRDLWRRPQAVQWETYGQEHQVALYVRRLVEAEQPESSVTLTTETRRMADALGLTIPGMRSLRWKIAGDPATEKRPAKVAAARASARDRFRVIDGAAEG